MFVLRLQQMRVRTLLGVCVVVLAASCRAGSDQSSQQDDWQNVLNRKKAALSPTASAHEKQVYADTLSAFLQEHPAHGRARAVYERIQLDFARELAAHGRHRDAIRFYRAVLAHDPSNEEATRGAAAAMRRLAVSRQELLALEKGMSQHEVAQLLGKPIPGWTLRNERRDLETEAWYYRTLDGGIAGVYFRDGVVLAAEATSNEKLTRISR